MTKKELTHEQILDSLSLIRPNAEFLLRGLEIEWLDQTQVQPTEAEILKGLDDFETKLASDKLETESNKKALFAKLGISEDEAKLLLA